MGKSAVTEAPFKTGRAKLFVFYILRREYNTGKRIERVETLEHGVFICFQFHIYFRGYNEAHWKANENVARERFVTMTEGVGTWEITDRN